MRCFALACLAISAAAASALAADGDSRPVRLYVSGGYCQGCVSVLTDVLKEAGAANASRIAPNRGKGFVIVLAELAADADLGALAKAVNEADTPHKAQDPPALALEVFTNARDEEAGQKARAALKSIDGVDAEASTVNLETGAVGARITGEAEVSVDAIVKALDEAGLEPEIRVAAEPAAAESN
jgi:copper chaperone CopZ